MTENAKRASTARDAAASVILKYRSLEGLSQTELARQLGISQPLVSSWECGRVTPSIVDIRNIEQALRTEQGEMLFQIAYPRQFANPNTETVQDESA